MYCLVNMSWIWSFILEKNRSWMLNSGEANERLISIVAVFFKKGFMLLKITYCKQNRSRKNISTPELSCPLITRLTLKNWQTDMKTAQLSVKTKMCERFEAWSLILPLSYHYLVCRQSLANQPAIAHSFIWELNVLQCLCGGKLVLLLLKRLGSLFLSHCTLLLGFSFSFSEGPKAVRWKLTAVEIAMCFLGETRK